MSDLSEMVEALTLGMARNAHFHEWLPKMDSVVVSYSSEEVFQAFQTAYYLQHGEHFCYTITDWLKLDVESKAQLIGEKVMLIKPRNEMQGIGGSILFNTRRYYTQRGNEFIVLKDATAETGKPYTPSFSY
ncbi:hypothetical protein ST201phi2-1p327 [Pseudomonas phage 201phi2-1]|uniref:Uncharacterized protein n=1 Tax=Pseudomonas phage 201phi2-1 TaxID=198110 RepID=B3FJI7_BP201|nr:hypothetical protein ST201phi2-1p327 [Pseudomonas phage 201phi2-1]ABY63152.1 hypothetical protein 201phi2-1p327 [Pseudomonas phage 201phi2-1]